MFAGIFIALFSVCMAQARVKASRNLHERLLTKIMRCPMSFFDTTPLGRIINRFSRDVDTVDVLIPGNIEFWLFNIFGVFSTMIVVRKNRSSIMWQNNLFCSFCRSVSVLLLSRSY